MVTFFYVLLALSDSFAGYSGPIADFELRAYFLQKAGVPFPLIVENARDSHGNPASGTVEILVEAGDGVSPYGYPPVLLPIQVINGTGEANQILTKAVSTALLGKAGEVIRRAEPILVIPAELDTFEVNIFSPQTSGHPFTSPSTLTSKDSLGNDKVDFDASKDTVIIDFRNIIRDPFRITILDNNVLKNSNDFVLGIADLSKLRTTYTGRGNEFVFQAGSQTGKSGFSNPVLIRNINFKSASASQDTLNPNDTLQITVSLYNVSNVSSVLESLKLFSTPPLSFELVQGSLPESLRAFTTMAFMFQTVIPENLINKIVKVGGKLKGKIEGLEVSDSIENLVSFSIVPESPPKISYVSGSLSPKTVSAGEIYSFQLTLKNEMNSQVYLSDSTSLQFANYQSNLAESLTIGENDTAQVSFSPAAIDSLLSAGKYPVFLNIIGTFNNKRFHTSLVLSDSVTVQRITVQPEEFLLNYPNPFEPGKEVTNFVFDLPQPSDLTLKIYTLSGELVNDFEIPAGTTIFAWDGRNGEGKVIQSGVYLAWLKIKNSGQEVKTKVAVVR